MGLLALNILKLAVLGFVPQLWSRCLMSFDAALNSPEWSIPFLPSCWPLRAECVASLAHLPRVIRGRGWPAAKQEHLALMDTLLELHWCSSGLLVCHLRAVCDGEAAWGLHRDHQCRCSQSVQQLLSCCLSSFELLSPSLALPLVPLLNGVSVVLWKRMQCEICCYI